jgi:hypothetical protein
MRLKVLASAVILLTLGLLAAPAIAQEQSGSIEGIVKDSSGGVLPGVTVEARGSRGAGVSTAVTDARGIYRFPALPPGTYEVTASLSGFTPAKSMAVISLGQLLKVDLALAVATVQETVQVTGESPLIDVKQAAAFTTVTQDTIERLPKGRDFSSIVSTAAGAQNETRQGGIQVDGSSGSENRFVIDGMDTTNLQAGTQGKTMLLDFIQEVQVKSSGYNAEFGGSTGGVISAITKSGSNNMHGTAGIYNQGDWGYGDRRGYHRYAPYTSTALGTTANFNPEGGSCAAQGMMGNVPACNGPSGGLLATDDPWRYLSPVADIGGPLMKDKLWYYAGWSYSRNNYKRDAIFYSDPQQVNRHFEWWSYSNYLNYNASSQLSNNLRVKFSGSNQKNRNRGGAPTLQPENDAWGFPGNAYVPAGHTMKGYTTTSFPMKNGAFDQETFDLTYGPKNGADSWNNSYSGNVDWVIKPTLFVNATAGYFMYNNTTPPEIRYDDTRYSYSGSSCGLLDVPSSYCQANGWTNSALSNSGTERNKFTRYFANVNGTWFKSMAGQHTFKAGVRYERFGNDVLTGATHPNVTLSWDANYQGTRGKYGYYELTQSGTVGNVHSDNYSFWLQDTWSLNTKLTVNAGIRIENETIPSYKGDVPDCNAAPNDPNCAISIKFGFGDKIAPRLGFAYDIKGDAKWKAYGSYSWYYDITKLELPRGSFGGDHWISYYWTLDTYDYSKIQCGEGSTGCPGTFISSIDWRHSSNQVDDIFSEYFDRPGMTGIDPNLKPVRTGDFQFGLDHELNARMSIGVRYIHKWVASTIEDVGIYAGPFSDGSFVEDYLISNPGEGYAVNMEPRYPNLITPKPKRNYDAVETHLRKRFSNNWAADATYTWSRIYGNYPGLASSDEFGRNSPNVNRLWDNTVMSYNPQEQLVYGLLNSDRPHQFKLSGSYDFKFGLSAGAFYIMQTGLPNTTVFRASGGGYPVFPYGRSDMGRLPTYQNLDMQLTQEFRVGGNKRISLQANFDNVFDLKNTTGWYYEGYGQILWHATGHNNLALPITYFYTPYDLKAAAAKYTAPVSAGGNGGSLWDNAFLRVPDQYQSRRQIRVSAKFSF